MLPIMEIFFFSIIIAPLIYIASGLKRAREYCEKQGWIFLAELFFVLGFPIKTLEDILE